MQIRLTIFAFYDILYLRYNPQITARSNLALFYYRGLIMARDYDKITKEITLVGFFSEYLPPCFKLNKSVLFNTPPENCDLIPPLCFSMSRFNATNGRRNIFIPEIGSYLVSYNYIRSNGIIKELITFCDKSDVSFSNILGPDNSIMTHEQSYNNDYSPVRSEDDSPSFYIQNICKKLIKASGANKILKLDISNCFSSFYVHMVPAILLGYEKTNEEYKKSLSNGSSVTIDPTYLKYRKLDDILRKQNLNRTNGLLVGTLYSKIILEGILCRIDQELLAEGIKFSRYVDDYEVYIFDDQEDKVISSFDRILKRYGFALNSEKIEIVDYPFYVTENLQKLFKDFSSTKLDTPALMKLFNTFLTMEKQGTKGAIRFLLKSIECSPIETDEKDLYKSYLLSILSNDKRSLVKACSLLIGMGTNKLNDADSALLSTQTKQFLANNYDLEVVWLVYLLIKCQKLKKSDELIELICNSDNELAQTILLRSNMLYKKNLSILKEKAQSWLLLYELFAADIISKEEFCDKANVKHNLDIYEKFKTRDLHFCSFDVSITL